MDDKKPHGRGCFRYSAMVLGAPDRAPTAAAIMHGNARISENFNVITALVILWNEYFIQDKRIY